LRSELLNTLKFQFWAFWAQQILIQEAMLLCLDKPGQFRLSLIKQIALE